MNLLISTCMFTTILLMLIKPIQCVYNRDQPSIALVYADPSTQCWQDSSFTLVTMVCMLYYVVTAQIELRKEEEDSSEDSTSAKPQDFFLRDHQILTFAIIVCTSMLPDFQEASVIINLLLSFFNFVWTIYVRLDICTIPWVNFFW